jgi:hypothetical protein
MPDIAKVNRLYGMRLPTRMSLLPDEGWYSTVQKRTKHYVLYRLAYNIIPQECIVCRGLIVPVAKTVQTYRDVPEEETDTTGRTHFRDTYVHADVWTFFCKGQCQAFYRDIPPGTSAHHLLTTDLEAAIVEQFYKKYNGHPMPNTIIARKFGISEKTVRTLKKEYLYA